MTPNFFEIVGILGEENLETFAGGKKKNFEFYREIIELAYSTGIAILLSLIFDSV